MAEQWKIIAVLKTLSSFMPSAGNKGHIGINCFRIQIKIKTLPAIFGIVSLFLHSILLVGSQLNKQLWEILQVTYSNIIYLKVLQFLSTPKHYSRHSELPQSQRRFKAGKNNEELWSHFFLITQSIKYYPFRPLIV